MENKECTNEKTMSKPLRQALGENGSGKITFHSIGFEVRHYNELECEVLLLYTTDVVYHTTSKGVRESVLKAKDLNPEATMFDLIVTSVPMNNGRTYFKAEVVPLEAAEEE